MHYLERIGALWAARGTADWREVVVAGSTFALLVGIPRLTKKIPAPLIAIAGAAAVVALVHYVHPSFSVATIESRFHGIPRVPPRPAMPWSGGLTFATVRELSSAAFAIAMLGAIESLLSAIICDGMTRTRHDPNAELVGLGIGNILAPFFGGIAATGALARTATNIRAGARSPIAAASHSILVLLAMVLAAPLVSYIPMASLAALLILVAWNMSETRTFIGIVKVAPRSDVAVLVSCFLLTVVFDMVVAMSVGFVMAAVLFMKRMSEITESKLMIDNTKEVMLGGPELPPNTTFYEVNGPLFFGAAQRAMDSLHASESDAFHEIIIHLGKVPVIDATGFAALENAVSALVRRKKVVVLAGPLPQPRKIFDKARLDAAHPGMVYIAPSLETALKLAAEVEAAPESRRSHHAPAAHAAE